MKFFTNKKFLFKLIATLCICLTIINFGLVPKANAEGLVSAIGGKLLDPVCDLLLTLGDGIMEIMQKSIMGIGANLIFDTTKGTIWEAIKTIAKIAISIVIGGLAIGALAAFASAIPIIGPMLAAGISSGVVKVGAVAFAYWGLTSLTSAVLPDNVVLPTYFIGPEEIFSGEILLLDPNIFNPRELYVEFEDGGTMTATKWNERNDDGSYKNRSGKEVKRYFYYKDRDSNNNTDENIITTSVNNAATDLKNTIAKWYYVIRNIAIIGLMLVLLYVGIRMLLSSIAAEKAKYKQMLSDWVIAICLVFLMQYIMVFANSFVEGVINIFSGVTTNQGYVVGIDEKNSEKIVEELKEEYPELYQKTVDSGNNLYWPTNLTGVFRIEAQKHDGTAEYVGYAICYIVLVLYTIFFIFTYLRRLLYILFLTVISPLVALTYPLDKIRDGQAQAFNMWLKEYIFNLLIQPFHLLLYVIFVSMAFDLAGNNVIYSLVVLGFMIPAEKFLKSMFGFDKAKTPGLLAGPAGAAMTISAVQSLAKFAGKGPGAKKPDGAGSNNKIQEAKNNFLDRDNDSGKTESALINSLREGNVEQNLNNPRSETQPVQGDNENDEDDKKELKFKLTDDEIEEKRALMDELESEDAYNNAYLNPEEYESKQARLLELENKEKGIDLNAKPEEEEGIDQNDKPEEEKEDEIKVPEKKMNYGKAMWEGIKSDTKDNLAKLNASKGKGWRNAMIKGVKSSAKSAGKFTLGATGAAVGIAAGIAAGSPNEAFKYGVTGAYAGSSIGEGLTNRSEKLIDSTVEGVKKRHEATLKTQYGSKGYKQLQNKKKDDEFFEDVDTRNMFAEKLELTKKEDIDMAMNAAIKYRQYGITDNKVIVNAMKYSKADPKNWASKENIAAAQLSSTSISKKDFKTTMDTLKQKGLSQEQTKDIGDRITFINESINNRNNK